MDENGQLTHLVKAASLIDAFQRQEDLDDELVNEGSGLESEIRESVLTCLQAQVASGNISQPPPENPLGFDLTAKVTNCLFGEKVEPSELVFADLLAWASALPDLFRHAESNVCAPMIRRTLEQRVKFYKMCLNRTVGLTDREFIPSMPGQEHDDASTPRSVLKRIIKQLEAWTNHFKVWEKYSQFIIVVKDLSQAIGSSIEKSISMQLWLMSNLRRPRFVSAEAFFDGNTGQMLQGIEGTLICKRIGCFVRTLNITNFSLLSAAHPQEQPADCLSILVAQLQNLDNSYYDGEANRDVLDISQPHDVSRSGLDNDLTVEQKIQILEAHKAFLIDLATLYVVKGAVTELAMLRLNLGMEWAFSNREGKRFVNEICQLVTTAAGRVRQSLTKLIDEGYVRFAAPAANISGHQTRLGRRYYALQDCSSAIGRRLTKIASCQREVWLQAANFSDEDGENQAVQNYSYKTIRRLKESCNLRPLELIMPEVAPLAIQVAPPIEPIVPEVAPLAIQVAPPTGPAHPPALPTLAVSRRTHMLREQPAAQQTVWQRIWRFVISLLGLFRREAQSAAHEALAATVADLQAEIASLRGSVTQAEQTAAELRGSVNQAQQTAAENRTALRAAVQQLHVREAELAALRQEHQLATQHDDRTIQRALRDVGDGESAQAAKQFIDNLRVCSMRALVDLLAVHEHNGNQALSAMLRLELDWQSLRLIEGILEPWEAMFRAIDGPVLDTGDGNDSEDRNAPTLVRWIRHHSASEQRQQALQRRLGDDNGDLRRQRMRALAGFFLEHRSTLGFKRIQNMLDKSEDPIWPIVSQHTGGVERACQYLAAHGLFPPPLVPYTATERNLRARLAKIPREPEAPKPEAPNGIAPPYS